MKPSTFLRFVVTISVLTTCLYLVLVEHSAFVSAFPTQTPVSSTTTTTQATSIAKPVSFNPSYFNDDEDPSAAPKHPKSVNGNMITDDDDDDEDHVIGGGISGSGQGPTPTPDSNSNLDFEVVPNYPNITSISSTATANQPDETWTFEQEEGVIASHAYSDVEITYIAGVICALTYPDFAEQAKLLAEQQQQNQQNQQNPSTLAPIHIFPLPDGDNFSGERIQPETNQNPENNPANWENGVTLNTLVVEVPESEVGTSTAEPKLKMSHLQQMLRIASCLSSLHLLFQLVITVLLTRSFWQKAIFGCARQPENSGQNVPPGSIDDYAYVENANDIEYHHQGPQLQPQPQPESQPESQPQQIEMITTGGAAVDASVDASALEDTSGKVSRRSSAVYANDPPSVIESVV